MTLYYEPLSEFERDGFDIVVDKTWETSAIRDCFDDTCYDIPDLEEKVNSGFYDWFMVRVRVQVEGITVGSAYLGGCLYEDAREVLKDGVVEDMIWEAMEEARGQIPYLRDRFAELSAQIQKNDSEMEFR
jgi:hypothetical protein